MDLQADRNWIISELKDVKDPDLIEAFKNLLKYRRKNENADWWDGLDNEQKADIEQGIKELERGERYSYESVISKYR